MLKKAIFTVSFIFLTLTFWAQKTSDVGVFLGRSYYLGEVNPKQHVGNGVGSFAYGAIFRYNLNLRYSLKASFIKTKLQANDLNTEFPFNLQRQASFETSLNEFAGTIEFNFLPYQVGDKQNFFSPYLFVGISYYTYKPNVSITTYDDPTPVDESKGRKIAFPFGPGIKVNLGRKIGLAFEWGFRKTSNDLLDGLENRYNEVFETGKNYDNDWYVLTGFMFNYKITDEGPCPAYNF